jgi:large-conductance mechanosensitive channel
VPDLGLPAWRGRRDCGHLCRAAFAYGQFVTAAGSFLISALVAWFILVMAVSRLQLPGWNRAATTGDCPPGAR